MITYPDGPMTGALGCRPTSMGVERTAVMIDESIVSRPHAHLDTTASERV